MKNLRKILKSICMKFVSEIFKLTWNCVCSHISRSLCVNTWIHSLGVSICLTSLQNRLTSILIFSRFCYLVPVLITSREFHRNPFSVLAKRKKYIWHGTEDGTDRSRDGQDKNIMPPLQHRDKNSCWTVYTLSGFPGVLKLLWLQGSSDQKNTPGLDRLSWLLMSYRAMTSWRLVGLFARHRQMTL